MLKPYLLIGRQCRRLVRRGIFLFVTTIVASQARELRRQLFQAVLIKADVHLVPPRLDRPVEQIEDSPEFGSVNTDFILGMGKIGETVKILLDIDKVLGGEDFSGMSGM